MGLTSVPADELATVVTTLRMTAPPDAGPPPPSPLRLVRWDDPSAAAYRALFRRVGERWLWYSRLALDDRATTDIITHPDVAVHAVVAPDGSDIGMVELDWRSGARCEIAYFGLVPELSGLGHGRWLMSRTLAIAWRTGVTEVVVNTCTLDSPRALGFYRAQGFAAVRRTIETFKDPRALGLIAADAAPQIPYLAASRR